MENKRPEPENCSSGDGEGKPGLPDDLNARIGVLTRREVEARVLAPLIDQLGKTFDREKVLEVVRDTIIQIGRMQGGQLAEAMGGNSMGHFAESLKYWTQDDWSRLI